MAHVLAKDLRASVLQAAMEGKLTEQLDSDSSVDDLLKDIQREKKKLVKEGKIKKEKPLAPIKEEKIPLEIPQTWKYTRIQDCFYVHSALRIHKSDWVPDGIPFLRGRELVKLAKTGEVKSDVHITKELFLKLKSKGGVPKKDDILISAVGTLGKVYVVNGTEIFYYKDAYILCLDNFGINPTFMKYLLESPYSQKIINSSDSYGTTVAQLTIEKTKNIIIPLPPLTEQQRIVDKLNKLMPLIDEYEKLENQMTELKKNFPEEMKASILQAAMQGKLTEQLESDGDVYDYFNSIRQKRKELIKEKQLKKESCLDSPIDETPFDIPDSWKWCYLGECIQLISGADLTPDRYNDKGQGTVYITGASNIENGKVIVNRWTDSPRSIAKKGDLLLTCKGTVGTACFLDLDEAHIARQIMSIRPIDVHPRYINAFISYYVNQLKAMAKSMIPGIERKNVLTALFPLPPIEEQQRIVEKLDKLLPLCDSLANLS